MTHNTPAPGNVLPPGSKLCAGLWHGADCERRTTVRLMRRIDITRHVPTAALPEQAVVHIEVSATAFLKNMVRILSGTLIQVGKGRMTAQQVAEALEKGDRTLAGPTAPAHGLTLIAVEYGPRIGY